MSSLYQERQMRSWNLLSIICFLLLLPLSAYPDSTANNLKEQEPPSKLGSNGQLDFLYHNYTVMKAYLSSLAQKYPDLTYLHSIGKSIKNRSLLALVVSSKIYNPPLGTPNIKFIGNIHGNEAVGRELILHMIEYLVTNYGKNKTVTHLLDTTIIHFLPSMNPDGFEKAKSSGCQGLSGRGNAIEIDLNRNFPDYFINNSIQLQPETIAIQNWMAKVPFILSASLHGGELVANYPYENRREALEGERGTASLAPDDDVFQHLAKVYARTHPTMHKGIPCNNRNNLRFEDGITNGAFWYTLTGGMQDYNYIWHGCLEITLEISCCKYPKHEELQNFWRKNKDALLNYAAEVHRGVKGIISNSSGNPIGGARLKIEGRDRGFNSSNRGEFWRILLPRKEPYYIMVEAAGYRPKLVPFYIDETKKLIWLNITMARFDEPTTETLIKTTSLRESKSLDNVNSDDSEELIFGDEESETSTEDIKSSFRQANIHLENAIAGRSHLELGERDYYNAGQCHDLSRILLTSFILCIVWIS
ncbi:hypothetical protein J437_LFUL005721 [Ladona fulva]|uniref:Peptidase M14 domain-containing protein n=1 Tax=Ladona fulva TaxID=123851 RepID=A0A8K0K187_LADFU|nr:hypothetical protein J437_LFUL005721 [Ladona fulva]